MVNTRITAFIPNLVIRWRSTSRSGQFTVGARGPHPYVRVGLDAFSIVNQLELQTTDHEMLPAGGWAWGWKYLAR